MSSGVSQSSSNRPELIDWIVNKWNGFLRRMNAFGFKCIVIVSSLALPLVSIWYSGWYPDAQQKIVNEQKNLNIKNGIYDEVEKPSFLYVTKIYKFDLTSPPPWAALSILIFFISQMTQLRLKDDNEALSIRLNNLERELGTKITENNSLEERFKSLEGEFSKFKEKSGQEVDSLNEAHGLELDKEKYSHYETRMLYASSLKNEVQNFFSSQKWFDNKKCRLSIYRFDKNKKNAHLIHRYCTISEFGDKGRIAIPADDGLISALLRNGEKVFLQIARYKKDNEEVYFEEMRSELSRYRANVHDDTFEKTRMKSSIYYGRAIIDNGVNGRGKFVVFVLESESPDAFTELKMDKIFNSRKDRVYKIVDHLHRLEDIMNPIKEQA